mmetsp:Transcript_36077/g.83079  ORF Transcript_36077/g.83079 Transcript_36077/m.83079 type:complete len:210 (-) Transcript_36077:40-669(-)
MDRRSCLSHILPFLDALELARSETANLLMRSVTEQKKLWGHLCDIYLAEELINQSGNTVPWPSRLPEERDSSYCGRLHMLATLVQNHEVVECQDCSIWISTDTTSDGLHCEVCGGHWCNDCAERGPCKQFVPCNKCPDFSQTHCQECFNDGKTLHCECSGTDSWHSCCGRCAWECARCNQLLCEGCEDRHDCPGDEDEQEEGEDEPDNP